MKSQRLITVFSFRMMGLAVALLTLTAPRLIARQAPAQPPAAAPADASQAVVGNIARAPVVLDGEPLFLVRGVSAYPAEQRAREIAARLEAVAMDRAIDVASLGTEQEPRAVWIVAGGDRLLAVLDEDAALERSAPLTLAQAYLPRIRAAIEAYRRDREPAQLWRSTLYTFGATLILFAAAYAGRRVVRGLRATLQRRYEARVQDVQIQAFQIVRAQQIWRALTGILNFGWTMAVLAMAVVFLRYVFSLFPWTRGLGYRLVAILIDPLRTMATGLVAEVPDLAFLVVLILITRYVLRMVHLFFTGVASGTVTLHEFDPEWAWPTYRLLRLFIIALGIVVAYPYIPGSQSDAFKGLTLFIGVVFSLGSSSLIVNIIAGYSMTYRRAFKIGDRVKIGEHFGAVERMRTMVTHIRTPKNEEVVLPNSEILSNAVVNYSSLARDQGLILHTTVGIGYETPWRQVEAMLLEAAARTPGLLREPPPFVLQTALGDFAVTYEINVYCATPETMPVLYTALHRNVLDVFNEYGVQIMTPAYEGDPEQPKLVPQSKWYEAPARTPEPPEAR